jgi:hypothetical protein
MTGVTVAVAVFVAACGGSSSAPTISTAKVPPAIESTILSHNNVHTKVTCPRRVSAKAGFKFTCIAALAVGAYPMYVVVKSTHGAGAFGYANGTPLRILNSYTIERAIEDAIRHQRHLGSTAVCPRPVLQSTGLKFTCVATLEKGGHTVFSVTETDPNGHVRFVGL